MDPVTAIIMAVRVVQAVQVFYRGVAYIIGDGVLYRNSQFGSIWGDFLYLSGWVDTDTIEHTHRNINTWTDAEVLDWKESHLASCNAIAVAAAIFASVGLQALSLPDLDKTHWICRAFLSSSMGLGVTASLSATLLHRTIAYRNDATSIRLWLSRGHSEAEPKSYLSTLPLESSVSAWSVSEAPVRLLYSAFSFFTIGFGLYLLLYWLRNANGSSIDQRNIFVFFICVMTAVLLQSGAHVIFRAADRKTMNDQYQSRLPPVFGESPELEKLERELKDFQTIFNSGKDIFMNEYPDPEWVSNTNLRDAGRPLENPNSGANTLTGVEEH